MGHDKLRKFAENETFACLLQPKAEDVLVREAGIKSLMLKDYPIKGHWAERMFHNDNPIVLELGCGKGDYTIALAERHPEINYIGVDIKGARLWKGAKYATVNNLPNVAFLRTKIEFLTAFFAPSEISQIWLTFSDPQMKSENSRLTSPLFLERYRAFLSEGGIINLKTDSRFLYEYSLATALVNDLKIIAKGTDIYGNGLECEDESLLSDKQALFSVQTFYEKMFLEMELPITYLAFCIDHQGEFVHPEFDDKYWREFEGKRRSFNHSPSTQ